MADVTGDGASENITEAKAFSEAATDTKKKLIATGLFAQGEGEEQEYDGLVGLLYR